MGDLNIMIWKEIFQSNPDQLRNWRNYRNQNLIQYHIVNNMVNCSECVRFLVRVCKCDVNHMDEFGNTPIVDAVIHNRPSIVKYLLENTFAQVPTVKKIQPGRCREIDVWRNGSNPCQIAAKKLIEYLLPKWIANDCMAYFG